MSKRNDAFSKTQSQYERKLARQRQMEMMEATASGTAPSMELDTSSFAETDGGVGSMRQRNQETARRFLHDEDEIIFQSSTARPSTLNSNLFAQRDQPKPSLNLMDHDTGVYAEPTSSFQQAMTSVKNLIFATTGTEHDASAAEADVFLGDAYSRHPGRSSRCSTATVMVKSILANKKRRAAMAAIAVALFVIIFSTLTLSRKPTEKVLRQENSIRFNTILDHIVLESVSHTEVFLDYNSAEYHALRWVAYSDPARLDPFDPLLLQRYALAVFYYGSFLAFEKKAGMQAPIEFGNRQFEGVPNPGWLRKDYWLSAKGICKWWGVRCVPNKDNETRYDDNAPVVSLNLTNNHVYGTIPPEFKGLDSLLALDLSRNTLYGTFPPQIARMFELQYIFLNRNKLSGQLPSYIGLLEGARDIHLGHNQLTGTIPKELGRLYNVRGIGLDNNLLTGNIPDLSSASKLQLLYVQNNRLSGHFPFTLAKNIHLRELRLENNKLSGTIPPEIESIHQLVTFTADNNALTGPLPDLLFERAKHLKEVDLQHNNLVGSLPKWAGHVSSLQVLQLNNNQFDGSIPTEWNGMFNLRKLHLYENHISGQIPTGFGMSRHLTELWIQKNMLSGSIPSQLTHCTDLQTIYLEDNKITGQIPSEFNHLTKMETLRLFNNKMEGQVPYEVCDLTREHRLTFLEMDCKKKVDCTCCQKCY